MIVEIMMHVRQVGNPASHGRHRSKALQSNVLQLLEYLIDRLTRAMTQTNMRALFVPSEVQQAWGNRGAYHSPSFNGEETI
jgi:hypothetical protein